jgi:hypothetical protein
LEPDKWRQRTQKAQKEIDLVGARFIASAPSIAGGRRVKASESDFTLVTSDTKRYEDAGFHLLQLPIPEFSLFHGSSQIL